MSNIGGGEIISRIAAKHFCPTVIGRDPWSEQAWVFRSFGESITEIGMREFDHVLSQDEVEAVRWLAQTILEWCDKP